MEVSFVGAGDGAANSGSVEPLDWEEGVGNGELPSDMTSPRRDA